MTAIYMCVYIEVHVSRKTQGVTSRRKFKELLNIVIYDNLEAAAVAAATAAATAATKMLLL